MNKDFRDLSRIQAIFEKEMEIVVIFLLTLLNGFFSLSEIALVSVKKNRIEHLAAKGNLRASTVLRLMENPENFLSSVQVGITLVGIISGAYGGAALTDDMIGLLSGFSFLGEYVDTISLILVIGSITFFTIVIGELVPKTLALNNPEPIALVCVPIIKYFTYATYPFVKLLSGSTKLMLKLFGTKEATGDHVSEEELKFILANAGKSGVLEREETEVHQNLFYFSDQTAKSLMTHSSEVDWIDIDDPIETVFQDIMKSGHTKFVVSSGQLENVRGVLTVRDFLENYKEADFKLENILDEPIYIAQNTPAFKILNTFKQKKQYLGVVIDEFGGIMGILTLHDLIETIVGSLPDEEDDVIEKIVVREDGSYLIDGKTPIFEFNRYFRKEIIEDAHHRYTTVAGFVLDQLQSVPKTGDIIRFENYKFEVVDLDGLRSDKVLMLELNTDDELSR
ncbi:MAG: hemolysin family protein [Bacteroidota bacterium]